MNRRNFLKTALAGAGALALSNFNKAFAQPMMPMPMNFLGNTNEIVSGLGIDCFPFGFDSVSVPTMESIFQKALSYNINMVDVSPTYNDAIAKLGEFMPDIRDRLFLSSKVTEASYDGAMSQLEYTMEMMKVDKIDLVMIQEFGDKSLYPDSSALFSSSGAIGALKQAKQQGMIKYIGVSGHMNPSRFHEAIDKEGLDVIQNPANFIIKNTYDFEGKIWSRAISKNMGIIAMDILGSYDSKGVAQMPSDKYNNAIRYAKSIDGVVSSLVGVHSVDELEKAVRAFTSLAPLSSSEKLSVLEDGLNLAKSAELGKPYGDLIN